MEQRSINQDRSIGPCNVATFHLASGFNCFALHCKEAKIDTEQEDFHPSILAESAALIEDEELDPDFQVNIPKATSFDLDGPEHKDPNCGSCH